MPPKHSIKPYVENGYYHIYNRGVEKRIIFQDEQDYATFLSYIKTYLSETNDQELLARLADPTLSRTEKQKITNQLRMNNFYNEITLIAYCLMPNHFHFFIKQKKSSSLDTFMNSLITRYVMYFNRKYKRVGSLFQGVYKGVLVDSEPYYLYLSAYIHRNPLNLPAQGDPLIKQPSSYPDYLGLRKTSWVDPSEILSFFSKTNPLLSYENFVKQTTDFNHIHHLVLEPEFG